MFNSAGRQIDRHDCEWSDVDGNGLPDVYCTTGRNSSNFVKTAGIDNELWLQLTPGTFTDVGTQWGVGDPCGRGRHIAFLDLDNDGWKDLFVGNAQPRNVISDPCDNPANGYPNENAKVFINLQGHGFRPAPEWGVNKPSVGVSCAVPIDYDRDGRMDLLTCHYVDHAPFMFHNTGSGFVEVSSQLGLTPISSAVTGDINGDSRLDLLMSDPKGFFFRIATSAGLAAPWRLYTTPGGTVWGWDVAIADINGDGRNDIYGLIHDDSLATNPDDVVFLRRADAGYDRLTPPSATGNGDTVTVIHPTPGQNARFLVQNGKQKKDGPIQVIAYTP